MKALIVLLSLTFSLSLFANTNFNAVLNKDTNILTISLKDSGLIPPYEAGELWDIMAGSERFKYINDSGFKLQCIAVPLSNYDIIGNCTLSIPMSLFQAIGDLQVFKLRGAAASRLNRYFTDSAYLSMQRGGVYLSSYNTRREFFFGIKDSLIKR